MFYVSHFYFYFFNLFSLAFPTSFKTKPQMCLGGRPAGMTARRGCVYGWLWVSLAFEAWGKVILEKWAASPHWRGMWFPLPQGPQWVQDGHCLCSRSPGHPCAGCGWLLGTPVTAFMGHQCCVSSGAAMAGDNMHCALAAWIPWWRQVPCQRSGRATNGSLR